ncbi:MAG TPA: CAP domain-containing protein [Thermoanaerobaculia bacterium]|nr:CAP domain-containing protein [Thermoanaerobaculia bacterium]
MRRTIPNLWVLFFLLAVLPAAGEVSGDGHDDGRLAFLSLINGEREKLGLSPLRLAPALSRAAQAHVDDMVARGYYELASPDGKDIEDWALEAGYDAQFLTEKILKTSSSPETVVAQWGRFAETHRGSLFHPAVEELGVGVGEAEGRSLYTLVFARSTASYLAEYVRHLFDRKAAQLGNLDALRQEMLRLVNEARAERGLGPLALDPRLNQAAQDYAEESFQAIRQGARRPGALARRVQAAGYRARSGVGESIVQGALSPAETLSALLEGTEKRPSILGKRYEHLGLGLAFERDGDGFFVVWVQCLASPFKKTPDMTKPGAETDIAPP